MPVDDWLETTVGDFIDEHGGEIKTGPFGTKLKASEYTEEGVPVISVGEVGYGELRLHDKTPKVDASITDRMPEYVLHEGDIVFGRKGAVERSARVREHQAGWFLGSDGIRLRLPTNCDRRFIAYQFLSRKHKNWMMQQALGSTMPSLNQKIIARIPIVVPPLPEQRAIASILGALDDKIELNRRMNATLESLARAIFKSWFVDFDPVKIKSQKKKEAVAKSIADLKNAGDLASKSWLLKSLRYELSQLDNSLFPFKLQDSKLGPIPEGWEVERFADHITVTRGLSYKGAGLADEGTPMHNLNSIYEGGGYKHKGIKYYTGEYRDRHEVIPGDLIATNTEQGFEHRLIGCAALVPKRYGEKGIYSHHIYRIRMEEESSLSPHYMLRLINSSRWHSWIAGFSNGTTINMLPKDALEMPLLVVPPAELVQHFTQLASSISDEIEDSILESESLARTRDALLPRLLSGELSVDELLTEQ